MSSFGITEYQKVYNLPFSYQINAITTAQGRRFLARGRIDGTAVRAVEFSIGEGGYNPFNYTESTPVNPEVTALEYQVFLDTIDELERPNRECACYYCVLEDTEANDLILGEIGIWAIIRNSPILGENGTKFLFALGHFPAKPKNASFTLAFRVVQQM